MSFCTVIMSGNVTGDINSGTIESGTKWCNFSIASNMGFGDSKKTIFMNVGAFGKNAENIAKFFNKGDEIIITNGTLSQRKHEGKTYTSIVINSWEFGKMKKKEGANEEVTTKEDDPFGDELPF